MALSRIGPIVNLSALSRTSNAAFHPLGNVHCTRPTSVQEKRVNELHVTSIRRYPDAPSLPLPTNVSEIFASETGRFAPERARDIAAPVLLYGKNSVDNLMSRQPNRPFDRSNFAPIRANDSHVESYDCFGAVSLNGTMQTNVPKPFSSSGKSTHLNMPGGQWARDDKYIAEDMQRCHYRSPAVTGTCNGDLKKMGIAINTILTSNVTQIFARQRHVVCMEYSTEAEQQMKKNRRDRFNKFIKDFGITAFCFHITISLASLGICYMIIYSGIDVTPALMKLAGPGNEKFQNILHSGTTFMIAYAVHKIFAPVRIGITMSAVPPLIMFLRRRGILKTPVPKPMLHVVPNQTQKGKPPVR